MSENGTTEILNPSIVGNKMNKVNSRLRTTQILEQYLVCGNNDMKNHKTVLHCLDSTQSVDNVSFRLRSTVTLSCFVPS